MVQPVVFCAPPGKPHRYVFTVYALKEKVPLDENATAAMVGFNLSHLKLRRVGVCRRAREVLLCVRAIFEPSI